MANEFKLPVEEVRGVIVPLRGEASYEDSELQVFGLRSALMNGHT